MSLRPWCSAPVPRGAALAAAFVAWVVRPALAGGLDDALALVPRDAVAMVAVPSVKSASDDLQLAIDRMGKAEAALGGRPIDLLKAQARVGPGFDDRGAVVAWARPVAGGLAHVVAMPVTDAQAFVSATLVPEPASGEGAMRAPGIDVPLWHRVSGSHVLVSDRKEALAEADVAPATPAAPAAAPGFPAMLAASLSVAVHLWNSGMDAASVIGLASLVAIGFIAVFERIYPHRTEWNQGYGDVGTDIAHNFITSYALREVLKLAIKASLVPVIAAAAAQ